AQVDVTVKQFCGDQPTKNHRSLIEPATDERKSEAVSTEPRPSAAQSASGSACCLFRHRARKPNLHDGLAGGAIAATNWVAPFVGNIYTFACLALPCLALPCLVAK
ncbi:MAG: hypothetical protein Q8O38_14665, partial [Sulfurimicrobium sp.]|nr:hypothetical protein [Sulfurimicrobium sp.]